MYSNDSNNQTNDKLSIPSVDTDNYNKKEYTGFVVLAFSPKIAPSSKANNLMDIARERKLQGLADILNDFSHIKTTPYFSNLPIDKILEMKKEAASGELTPLERLASYWYLDCREVSEEVIERLVKELNQLPEINLAYREEAMRTAMSVNADDDPLSPRQNYLDAAPIGIDARWAWTQGYDGSGVGFVDTEGAWLTNHEDLVARNPTIIFGNNNNTDIPGRNHGTAVLGIVSAEDNNVGIVGIAPRCSSVRMASKFDMTSNTNNNHARAIKEAADKMNFGDVLLLELQTSTFLPTETDQATFDAISYAVNKGIVVVEAAGNGNQDLDSWTNPNPDPSLNGKRTLDRNSSDFKDSGTIMVGASRSMVEADSGHARAVLGKNKSSNFGSRVDCYAWGENIATCGYGGLVPPVTPGTPPPPPPPPTQQYTMFGGTSGASAIIAGAALILQSIALKKWPRRLHHPRTVRSLFRDTVLGTRQSDTVPGNIGVMPDLRALVVCYEAPINHNLILDRVVEPNGPSNRITSGVSTLTAPLCNKSKEYSWELFHTPEKVICKASSRACVAPVFHWNVNGIDIDKDMAINPQIAVSVNDLTTPINLATSIIPVPIDCKLKHTPGTQDNFMLTLTPGYNFIGHFQLTIILSSSDPVSTPNPDTVEVNMERLFIDWRGDSKRCLDDTIHYLDHRIVADPRLELVKSFLEPSPDYAHVLTELREIMKVLQKVSVTKPEVAQELVAKITEILDITPKELNAFLPE